MKSSLRTHHQLIILAIILFIHGGMLMTFIIQMNQGGPYEPIIMVEPQDQHDTFPERDWVALNNSMPNTQMATMAYQDAQPEIDKNPEVKEKKEQEEEHEKETADEQTFDEALAMATQILEKEKTVEAHKQESKKETIIPEKQQIPSPRTQLTLAQLAQGFSEQLQQADMAVRSDRGGVASIDQIKHISYCQKIIGCLVNSYKINNSNCPTKILKNRARIHLALNKNGSIHQLTVQQSSGDPGIDQFLVHMFKDAATSFPPVPEALHADPYHLPTFTIDNLESFHSQQGWYIDNRT